MGGLDLVTRNKIYILASITVIVIIATIIAQYLWQQNQILMQLQQQAKQEEEARQRALLEEQLQKQSVDSISVEMPKWNYTKSSTYFTADIELIIRNEGTLDVSLGKATTTLFINDINVQTKGFQQEVLVIRAYGNVGYTATFGTFDGEAVSKLQTATQYQTVLQLSAEAACGKYSSAIQISHEGTWS